MAGKQRRKIAIFGLTVSSSWGNGHATLWRGLLNALSSMQHDVVFFERDVSWYADSRDLHNGTGYELVLYRDWKDVAARAERELSKADVGIVTSYCPDAIAASEMLCSRSDVLRVFYDLDTPVTLAQIDEGRSVDYVPADGFCGFDLVLSFTGGRALDELRERLGARRALPVYGSADPVVHRPVERIHSYRSDLSYLGTYAADRQPTVERLFVASARQLPDRRFLLGGSMYPQEFPWTENIHFLNHVAPAEHAAFYCSSRLTLNVTRAAMASRGYCPSGRLFEAAACGTATLSDDFEGLETFFEPGREILIARSTEEAVAAMQLPDRQLAAIGAAARRRVTAEHTASARAQQMLEAFDSC